MYYFPSNGARWVSFNLGPTKKPKLVCSRPRMLMQALAMNGLELPVVAIPNHGKFEHISTLLRAKIQLCPEQVSTAHSLPRTFPVSL